MPTISSSNIPTPKSWGEFEDIVLAAAKLRWNATDFFRNGRQGQKQDGVDVWGHDDDRHIGIQCKNTINGITLNVIKEEITNAERFSPPLDRLYIATTAKRDEALQKAVRELSKKRGAKSFKVDLLFWDDIVQDLAKDENVFFQHYPQLRPDAPDPVIANDKTLFDALMALLPFNGVIRFVKEQNMAGFSFPEARLEPLREFYYDWNVPERQFLTPELEQARAALWVKTDAYLEAMSLETYPTKNPDWHSVPQELELTDPKRFYQIVNKLHGLAGEVVALHAALVTAGQKNLIASDRKHRPAT